MLQRDIARAKANRVRFARADLKRRIKAGTVDPRPLILDPPDDLRMMPVSQLVKAQHRYGPERTRKPLTRAVVDENKPLGMLTVTQRRRLVYFMGGWEG